MPLYLLTLGLIAEREVIANYVFALGVVGITITEITAAAEVAVVEFRGNTLVLGHFETRVQASFDRRRFAGFFIVGFYYRAASLHATGALRVAFLFLAGASGASGGDRAVTSERRYGVEC